MLTGDCVRPDYNIIIAAIAGALVAKEIDWVAVPVYNYFLNSLPRWLCLIIGGGSFVLFAIATTAFTIMLFDCHRPIKEWLKEKAPFSFRNLRP